MKGYFIFDNVQVHDSEKLEQYKHQAIPLLKKYLGKYLVIGGRQLLVEGTWKPSFLVILEFPSYDQALLWYNSSEYQLLKELRLSALTGHGLLIEGASEEGL